MFGAGRKAVVASLRFRLRSNRFCGLCKHGRLQLFSVIDLRFDFLLSFELKLGFSKGV